MPSQAPTLQTAPEASPPAPSLIGRGPSLHLILERGSTIIRERIDRVRYRVGIVASGAPPARECLRRALPRHCFRSGERITGTVDVVIADGEAIGVAGVIPVTHFSRCAVVIQIVIATEQPAMARRFGESEANQAGCEACPSRKIPSVVE